MHRPHSPPVLLQKKAPLWFPDPRDFDRDGLLAIGGDLSPARLLLAYQSGIFPWYEDGMLPMWWSPDPRACIDPSSMHVSRSLRRTIRRGGFQLTWNRCFLRVMQECGLERREGTWVIPEMLLAYDELHRRGHAHSLEVWQDGELAAGIYGVQVGGLFAAESMFHRRADMSKVALVALVGSTFRGGVTVLDVQFATPHLRSLGACELPRAVYLQRIEVACRQRVSLADLRPGIDLGGPA